MKKRYLLLILVILLALSAVSCSNVLEDPFIDFTYEKEEEDIELHSVERVDLEVYDQIFAKTIPKDKVTQTYVSVSGLFLEYRKDLLDEVKVGDVIAVLDGSHLDNKLRDQMINYEKAKLKYEKAKMEYESSGQGENAMKIAKLDFDYEEHRLNSLYEQYDALELKAEIDGVLTKRYKDTGDFVKETDPIFDITDDSEIFVAFDSSEATGLSIGENLEIEVRNSDELIVAEVVSIDGTEVRLVPEYIHDSFRRTGTLVYIRILIDKRLGALVIEDNSIISEAGRSYVYVWEDGIRSERDIKTGIESADGYVEVIFGLEEGEEVVSRPY